MLNRIRERDRTIRQLINIIGNQYNYLEVLGFDHIRNRKGKIMLEYVYGLIGYENCFDIKADNIRKYIVGQAHMKLMDILTQCKSLGIIDSINEDKLDEIEDLDE